MSKTKTADDLVKSMWAEGQPEWLVWLAAALVERGHTPAEIQHSIERVGEESLWRYVGSPAADRLEEWLGLGNEGSGL